MCRNADGCPEGTSPRGQRTGPLGTAVPMLVMASGVCVWVETHHTGLFNVCGFVHQLHLTERHDRNRTNPHQKSHVYPSGGGGERLHPGPLAPTLPEIVPKLRIVGSPGPGSEPGKGGEQGGQGHPDSALALGVGSTQVSCVLRPAFSHPQLAPSGPLLHIVSHWKLQSKATEATACTQQVSTPRTRVRG